MGSSNRIPPSVNSEPIQKALRDLTEQQQLSLAIPVDCRLDANDGFYISTSYYSGTQAYIDLYFRILGIDGQLTDSGPLTVTLRLNNAAELVTTTYPNISGSIVAINAVFRGATAAQGTCFVQVGIIRSGARRNVLIAGYISPGRNLSYPCHVPIQPLQTSGKLRYIGSFSGALPIYCTPTAGVRWRIQTIYISAQTSAAVGNRNLYLEMQQTTGPITLAIFPSEVVQPAGAPTTWYYCFRSGPSSTSLVGTTGYVMVSIPDGLTLPYDGRFKVDYDNRQAGDIIGWIQVYGEEILEF